MPSSVNLGARLEAVVDELVKNGRYNSRSEVLREGVRIIHEREQRLAEFEAVIALGIADADAGRVHDLDDVFDELDAEIAAMTEVQDKG